MPTPPKPHLILVSEGKSHRTKQELEQRKKAEEALASGTAFKERREVREDPVAHKEFMRIKKLLKSIGKNDALYEPVINRYCMLQSECREMEQKRERIYQTMIDMERDKEQFCKEDTLTNFYKIMNDMEKNLIGMDKQVQSKRIMLLNIEKENIMTIASALRSIPKKVDTEESDPLKGLNKYGC